MGCNPWGLESQTRLSDWAQHSYATSTEMCSGKKCLCPQNDLTEQIIFFSCHRCIVFILYELVITACNIFPS